MKKVYKHPVYFVPEHSSSGIEAWTNSVKKVNNKKNDMYELDDDSLNDYVVSKEIYSELAPYYDKNSTQFSLTEQAKIFEKNPYIHEYLCRKFNLPLPMYYG